MKLSVCMCVYVCVYMCAFDQILRSVALCVLCVVCGVLCVLRTELEHVDSRCYILLPLLLLLLLLV